MFLGDFYIVDYEYDMNTGLAKRILICEGRGTCTSPAFWVTREQVIGLIEDRYTAELLPPEGQKVYARRIVRLVEVSGKKYLRTDGAAVAADSFER